MIVEDGKKVSDKIPDEIKKKFVREGIQNPFYCRKLEEFRACGK